MKPEDPLPWSQKPSIRPYYQPVDLVYILTSHLRPNLILYSQKLCSLKQLFSVKFSTTISN
jgi:hypothetical protein